MIRSQLAAALLAAIGTALPAPGREPVRVVNAVCPAPALHQAERHVIVILPPSYDRQITRRYPVIVFLHGQPGNPGDWLDKGRLPRLLGRLESSGRMPEVIALAPDANGTHGRSYYLNAPDGRDDMETFLTGDLIAWADRTFRTRADARDRALVGISDGASAALDLTFRHPDRFGACAGHSGSYDLRWSPRLQPLVGAYPAARSCLASHSPLRYAASMAPRLRGLDIWFDCGLLDGAFADDRQLDRVLRSALVPHVYEEWLGWHGWSFWRRRLAQSLPFVTRDMRQPPAARRRT
ncbi:MAG TPA: alpha/beta hydrolase-fold protein [Candidatus Eisenbacteria bacterium]|nr:alpha/beta hydrolase-fold protein [Candidatus Eisenbacteria bacterium]